MRIVVRRSGSSSLSWAPVALPCRRRVRSTRSARASTQVATARASGQRLGRPPSLTPDLVLRARELLTDANATVASVARQLDVGRSSLYRHLPELTGRAQPNGRAEDFDAQLAPAGSERQPDGDRSTLGPGAATGTPERHRSRR